MKLKLIHQIYSDFIAEIIPMICTNPLRTIPSVLSRIRRFYESYMQQKKEQNKHWKECCEKNFYKSLDHKSFYFRQSEKKSTNSKSKPFRTNPVAFLAEITRRYNERMLSATPLAVRKGGSQGAIYFNNPSMVLTEAEASANKPVPGDEVAGMSERFGDSLIKCDVIVR